MQPKITSKLRSRQSLEQILPSKITFTAFKKLLIAIRIYALLYFFLVRSTRGGCVTRLRSSPTILSLPSLACNPVNLDSAPSLVHILV
jgi:hypothetical protein